MKCKILKIYYLALGVTKDVCFIIFLHRIRNIISAPIKVEFSFGYIDKLSLVQHYAEQRFHLILVWMAYGPWFTHRLQVFPFLTLP